MAGAEAPGGRSSKRLERRGVTKRPVDDDGRGARGRKKATRRDEGGGDAAAVPVEEGGERGGVAPGGRSSKRLEEKAKRLEEKGVAKRLVGDLGRGARGRDNAAARRGGEDGVGDVAAGPVGGGERWAGAGGAPAALTVDSYNHLSPFNQCEDANAANGDSDEEEEYELRAGDVVVYFRPTHAYGKWEECTWALVVEIQNTTDQDGDPNPTIRLNTWDVLRYHLARVCIFRHDEGNVLRDVTGGSFISLTALSFVAGEMAAGTYATPTDVGRTIMRRREDRLNTTLIEEGFIGGEDDRVSLGIHGETVQGDEVLGRIMELVIGKMERNSKKSAEAAARARAALTSPARDSGVSEGPTTPAPTKGQRTPAIDSPASEGLTTPAKDSVVSEGQTTPATSKGQRTPARDSPASEVLTSPGRDSAPNEERRMPVRDSAGPKGLMSAISSPTKVALSTVRHRKDWPTYEGESLDENGNRLIHYHPAPESVTVLVQPDELRKLLVVELDSDGLLGSVTWAEGANRADFVTSHFRDVVPAQFIIRCGGNRILGLSEKASGPGCGRGGSKKGHRFVVLLSGKCMAHRHGCPTTYNAGFDAEQLLLHATNPASLVQMTMDISGSGCLHRHGFNYGLCRGSARQEQVRRVLEEDKLLSPSEVAQRNLDALPDEKYAVNNTDGVATTRSKMYECNREAKAAKTKDMGAGTKCRMINLLNASPAIRQMDKDDREAVGDRSTDYLGIVQDIGLIAGFSMYLFTKKDMLLFGELAAQGKLILYYDGTGQLLRMPGTPWADKVQHSLLSFQPREVLVEEDSQRHSSTIFTSYSLAEHCSNMQTGAEHATFVRFLMRAASSVRGSFCPAPLLVNTDCAGQLQNGWIIGAAGHAAQASNGIIWHNAVLPCLLRFDSATAKGNAKPAAMAILGFLRPNLIATFLHACTSHVCLAGSRYTESDERPKEVKDLGERIVTVMAHLFYEMTHVDTVAEAITLLCSIIVILNADEIPCPDLDLSTPVREHRDKEEMARLAKQMKKLKGKAARLLHVDSDEEMEALVQVAMEDNHKAHKQKFSGVAVSQPVMDLLSERMVYSYVYLHEVCESEGTGTVHIHIVYDTTEDDGKIKPVFAGWFERTVSLPYNSGSISNPMKCHALGKYLVEEWQKSPALWSRDSVRMLEEALGMSIMGNNQHAERKVRTTKEKADVKMFAAKEPSTWALHRWKEQKKAGKTLVKEYEGAAHILASRKEKEARKLKDVEGVTADALENEKFDTTDAIWDTGSTGPKFENKLRDQMEDIFSRLLPNAGNNKKFEVLEKHVNNCGVGNLVGMKRQNFNDWMNGKRATKKRIGANVIRACHSFIKEYENVRLEVEDD